MRKRTVLWFTAALLGSANLLSTVAPESKAALTAAASELQWPRRGGARDSAISASRDNYSGPARQHWADWDDTGHTFRDPSGADSRDRE